MCKKFRQLKLTAILKLTTIQSLIIVVCHSVSLFLDNYLTFGELNLSLTDIQFRPYFFILLNSVFLLMFNASAVRVRL
jgi:hypothetical protein